MVPLLFLSLFFFFLIPASDPDLGWYLRCGQDFWRTGSWCVQNQYSVFLAGYIWPNLYWLYQAILYWLFRLFSLWGLTFANAFLMSLSFFFFYHSIKNFAFEKILAIFVIIFLGWGIFSFGLRSQLMGFFFFNLILWINSLVEENPKRALWYIPVMFFWAQMHGSTILGLILIFTNLFFLGFKNPQKRLFFSFMALFSFLITLVNPFGWQIYTEGWRHVFISPLDKTIAEWVPPNTQVWWLIVVSFISLISYYLFKPKSKGNFLIALSLIPMTYLSLKARRYVPFYFSLGFYLFFLNYQFKKIPAFPGLSFLTLVAFLCGSLIFRLPQTILANSSWQNWYQGSSVAFPYKAVEFLRNQQIKGNIFNSYEWGGFLIWQLPEFKVFVDGRMPSWLTPSGIDPYTTYLITLQTQDGWQDTLAKYQIDWLLIGPGTFMDLKLSPNPLTFGWKEVYRDKQSVIYQKKI
jgi:hypothetical protein